METTTKTNQNNRELTATEIKIALAQIEDRLMRIAKSQKELGEFMKSDSSIDDDDPDGRIKESELEKTKSQELRVKYEIPDGVHLFYECCESALVPASCATVKPYLAAWVKGSLTEHQCSYIYFWFEECEQADWGWIMLERPLGYYDCKTEHCPDETLKEMIAIGTRSKRKNNRLPQIAGAWSSN